MGINKEKKFVSVVAYLHNDEDLIEYFFNNITDILIDNFECFEIIFVNDGSNDGSVNLIKNISLKNRNYAITILNLSFHQGLELSMNAGVDLAIGDFVFEFNSVFIDYDPTDVFKVFQKSLEGYDIVSFSPSNKIPLSSIIFYKLFNFFSKFSYQIQTNRFIILSRRAINRINLLSTSIIYRKIAYVSSGLKVFCINYTSLVKKNITEKKTFRQERAISSLIIFTNIVYKITFGLTIFFFGFTLLSFFYTIYVYLGQHKPIEGWTTIMFLTSVGLSGLFFVLAIILKYLSILIELILKKQKYLVESIEKL